MVRYVQELPPPSTSGTVYDVLVSPHQRAHNGSHGTTEKSCPQTSPCLTPAKYQHKMIFETSEQNLNNDPLRLELSPSQIFSPLLSHQVTTPYSF